MERKSLSKNLSSEVSEFAHKICEEEGIVNQTVFKELRDGIEDAVKKALPPKESPKEELTYQIEQLLLEILKIPHQPFLLAVEEIMGFDYWEERVSRIVAPLSEYDLDTLQSISQNLKNIKQKWKETGKSDGD